MDIQKLLLIMDPLHLYHDSCMLAFMHSSLSCHLLRSTKCQALEGLEIEKQEAGQLLSFRNCFLGRGAAKPVIPINY